MHPLRHAALVAKTIVAGPTRRRRMTAMAARGNAPMSILFYHRVAHKHPNDWTIHPNQFERHLDFIQQNYEVVDLETIQARLTHGHSPRPAVAITFDDGYAENLPSAIASLTRRGLPATYFVSTDHIATGCPFAHDVAAGVPLAVNSIDQIRQIADAGIEIGLHTASHVDFAQVTDPVAARLEIIEAKASLETMVERPVRYFAVPFGLPEQMTRLVFDTARQAGLSGVLSAHGGYNVPGDDPFHLRRIHGDPQFARLRNWLSFDPAKHAARPPLAPISGYSTPRFGEGGLGGEGFITKDLVNVRPLKTLFVLTDIPVGGAEILLANLLDRFDPNIISPELVCLKQPGPLGKQLAEKYPLHHGLIRGRYDVAVLPRLVSLFRRRGTGAVVTVGAGDKMFWGRIAARIAGVPVIVSALHSTGWPDGVGRLNRTLTPLTDAFIAVADDHARHLRDREQFPAAKVHTIRNGVDCARFAPDPSAAASVRDELGLPGDASVIGILAAQRPEKNHPLLIEALASLPDVHLVVIGSGPCDPINRQACQTHGVSDRVHFPGNRDDTPRLLAGLDVKVLASLNEASPVSILEALACGTPVVATKVGSVAETVLPGRTGILVPSGDPAAMSAAIAGLLADPARRIQMGLAGRRHVVATGSLESMVEGYTSLLTRLFEQKTGRIRPHLKTITKAAPAADRPACRENVEACEPCPAMPTAGS